MAWLKERLEQLRLPWIKIKGKLGIHTIQDTLSKVLLAYRSTPHVTTGKTPSELFIGRALRTRVSLIHPSLASRVRDQQARQMKYDRRTHLEEFQIDDLVWCKNFRGGDKWIPGKIVGKKGTRVYTILIHGQVKAYHRDQIRKRWRNGEEDESGDGERQPEHSRGAGPSAIISEVVRDRGYMESLSPGLTSQRSDQDSEVQSDTDDGKSLEPLRSLDPEALKEEGPVLRRNPPRARRPPDKAGRWGLGLAGVFQDDHLRLRLAKKIRTGGVGLEGAKNLGPYPMHQHCATEATRMVRTCTQGFSARWPTRQVANNIVSVLHTIISQIRIEQNPGPRSAKQMTMESYREKDLAEMIATLTTKIDDLGQRLETRLSSLESGMKELNQRFQHIETSLEKTAKAVSINSERVDSFERRLDLCEMRQRENNLMFYGIEGKECEAPTDTRAIIMNLFSEKMQIQENITIQQCRRLTKKANSPILIEVPEHNERIMLFKNMFRLKNTRIYLNKDYSVKRLENNGNYLSQKGKNSWEKVLPRNYGITGS
ncbi:K02A2.6-like [Cordylochernes scorpioides]|uniref:K02A2.6-like n=1 Tax=Cordylochernes scorpioides TaxID=51811 RepID=A0ABY6LHC8_9ARAC|nr:K02A2.6-like [Cordylochernes scorpioides]